MPLDTMMPSRDNASSEKRLEPCSPSRSLLRLLSIVILLAPLIAGCLSFDPLPTATPSPLPATHTPTFVIPTLIPTSTWMPVIPPPPTRDLNIGRGAIIFADDFEQDLGWDLEEDIYGATALTSGRLTLATRRPGVWRAALSPTRTLADFYVEINLRVDICSSRDEFGLILRVNSLSDHYQFGLRCEGGMRVTRISGGAAFTLIPHDQADIVVPGPPEENRLSVWASGNQFRFFINHVEVFSARDSTFTMGSIGVYIKSGNAGQASVSFDNFTVRSLSDTPLETPTPATPEESNGS